MVQPLTMKTALEVASHEALVRQAYKNRGDVWTWSIGLTSATGHMVERYIGNPQPIQKCINIYVWALRRYAIQVEEAFTVKLTEAQFAAALSFHWNTGGIKRALWVKHWNAGDVEKAKADFMNWTKPKSLLARRQKEFDLFFDGKWSNRGNIIEYTRVRGDGSVDFSSGKTLDIQPYIEEAFLTSQMVIPDFPPNPSATSGPTLTPTDLTGFDHSIPLTYMAATGLILAVIGFILLLWSMM